MTKIFIYFIILFFSKLSLFYNSCIPGRDHCSICNPLTDLCYICDKEVFVPNEKGGCDYTKICKFGLNYCIECSQGNEESENICIKCEEGYYPDEYGGCSYSRHCILSERGKCLQCKNDYILVGMENVFNDGIKICKSIFSEDLKFCESINKNNGLCDKCKEDYYVNQKDRKCSTTKNCEESIFGICSKCQFGYYLDKIDNQCKSQKDKEKLIHCAESLNGENCDICDDNFFFDENGVCIYNNYCLVENENNKCEKCADNYFLSEKDSTCTKEPNCLYGDRTSGMCISCKENYYIDYKDGKCKSNIEENDFKYCKVANDVCTECVGYDFFIGEDHKCCTTKYCSESYNGTCVECMNKYHLGLDKRCSYINHCIYSDLYNKCLECEGEYYFNRNEDLCKIGEGNLTNCKISNNGRFCESCKDDFYLNQTDQLCYINTEPGPFYRCGVTDLYGEYCIICSKGYYMGEKDNKCSKVEGCVLSEKEDKCLECEEDYCLDVKTGKCEYNDYIENEEKMFYYKCNKTNIEGTRCEICVEDYRLNENGLCVNDDFCEEKNDNVCLKCKSDDGNYCLNKYFECVEVYYANCFECDDVYDFDSCTKCQEGYEVNSYGSCVKIKEN